MASDDLPRLDPAGWPGVSRPLIVRMPVRDPAGMIAILVVAFGPAVRVVSGFVRNEGPTLTMVALSVLIVALGALEGSELARAVRPTRRVASAPAGCRAVDHSEPANNASMHV